VAKSDADCIVSAYEDAIGGLFKQMFQNLSGDPKNEQTHVTHFTNGVQLARHAKQLALGVIGPAPAVARARRRVKR
jgi:hypothetical protein